VNFLKSIQTRWVVWVWKHTPTCAEISRLASRELEAPLTVKTRMQMWLHFLICAWCEHYYKHLKFLHRAAPSSIERATSMPAHGLSPEAKQRLLKRLRENSSP